MHLLSILIFYFKSALRYYLNKKNWDEAQAIVEKYSELFPDIKRPEDCNVNYTYFKGKQEWFGFLKEELPKPVTGVEMQSLKNINTRYKDEFYPVVTTNGKTLYFSKESPSLENGEDIYVSHFIDGQWSKPDVVDTLSSTANEAPLSITSDGNELLIFRNRKLYISKRGLETWEEPVALPDNINNRFVYLGSANIYRDKTRDIIILEASDKPEEDRGINNTDLYVSFRSKGSTSWSDPAPLNINTAYMERSPIIHVGGEYLYFCSDGYLGMGEIDLFRSKRLDNTWTNWGTPLNLGKEINTIDDDWGYAYNLSADGKTAYLAREQRGKFDIYATGLPKEAQASEVYIVSGKLEKKSGKGAIATVIVVEDATTGKVINRVKTNPDGSYSLVLTDNTKVKYVIEDKRYFPIQQEFDPTTIPEGTSYAEVEFPELVSTREIITDEITIALNNKLLFETNSIELKEEAKKELDKIFEVIDKQDVTLHIAGHTDNSGTPEYNLELSQKRADAVKDYLTALGFPAKKLIAEGMGETQPKVSNDTEEGKSKNRRVEITFNKKEK